MTRKEEIEERALQEQYMSCTPKESFVNMAEWADKTITDRTIKFFWSKAKHGMIEENINVFIEEFCKEMEE